MKKICILLTVLLLLSLTSGCKDGAETEAPQETAGTKLTSTLPGAADPNDPRQIAESLIDHDVSELIAAIGEPQSSDYVTSCLGPGQDGELVYDGFTVFTYREGDYEIVMEVEG